MEYGYISGEMGRQDEVLVVVRRSLTQPQRPSHDIKRFQTDLDSGVSRVYLYNGVWSNNTDLQGLTLYTCTRNLEAFNDSMCDIVQV